MAEPVGWQAMRSVLLLYRSMAAVVDQELKDLRLRSIDFQILKQLQSTETGTCLLGEVARKSLRHFVRHPRDSLPSSRASSA